MPELEITWGRVASIWWLVVWRIFAGGLILGVGLGVIVATISAIPIAASPLFSPAVAILGIFLLWPFVIRMALTKRYKGFRIALVPLDAAEGSGSILAKFGKE